MPMTNKNEECSVKRGVFLCLSACGLLVLAVSGTALSATPENEGQTAQQGESEQDGIRTAIENYFKGHATGDASYLRKAFMPTAHIEGVREGKLTSWTVEEYCARFTGKPANDETSRVRTIDSIDVTGSSAMAKATLRHGATTFTDYLILLKVDGEWKIANKVYSVQRNDAAKQ